MIRIQNGKVDKFSAVCSLVGGAIRVSGDDIKYYDGQTPPSKAEIDAEVIRLQAEYDAQEYARNRASAYPSIPDQLDEIYHNGIDSWKALIKVTKDKYPKG